MAHGNKAYLTNVFVYKFVCRDSSRLTCCQNNEHLGVSKHFRKRALLHDAFETPRVAAPSLVLFSNYHSTKLVNKLKIFFKGVPKRGMLFLFMCCLFTNFSQFLAAIM